VSGPSRGEGGEGKVFPGPATFGGLRHRSKIGVLDGFFLTSNRLCIKSIFGAPDPAGEAYDAPQAPSRMVRGGDTPPHIFHVSVSAGTE